LGCAFSWVCGCRISPDADFFCGQWSVVHLPICKCKLQRKIKNNADTILSAKKGFSY